MKKQFSTVIVNIIVGLGWIVAGTASAAGGGGVLTDANAAEGKHFHAKGKLPSSYTIEAQKRQRKQLPFSDKRDFEEQKKGFIAAPEYKKIMAKAGNVA